MSCVSEVECPTCKAKPGQECRYTNWVRAVLGRLWSCYKAPGLHEARMAAYYRYKLGTN